MNPQKATEKFHDQISEILKNFGIPGFKKKESGNNGFLDAVKELSSEIHEHYSDLYNRRINALNSREIEIHQLGKLLIDNETGLKEKESKVKKHDDNLKQREQLLITKEARSYELESAIKTYEKRIPELQLLQEQLETSVQRMQKDLDYRADLEEDVKSLSRQKIELERMLLKLENEIEDSKKLAIEKGSVEESLAELNQRKEFLTTEILKLTTEVENLKKLSGSFIAEKKSIDNTKVELQKLKKDLDDKAAQLSMNLQSNQEKESEIARREEKLKNEGNSLLAEKENIEQMKAGLEADIKALDKKKSAIQAAVSEFNSEKAAYSSEIENEKNRFEEQNKMLVKKQDEVEEIKGQIAEKDVQIDQRLMEVERSEEKINLRKRRMNTLYFPVSALLLFSIVLFAWDISLGRNIEKKFENAGIATNVLDEDRSYSIYDLEGEYYGHVIIDGQRIISQASCRVSGEDLLLYLNDLHGVKGEGEGFQVEIRSGSGLQIEDFGTGAVSEINGSLILRSESNKNNEGYFFTQVE